MKHLIELVRKYTKQTKDEGIDMFYFFVKLKRELTETEIVELKQLIIDNYEGEFQSLNPFVGEEHSYINVGAWIGDQGLAMQFMGLGELLGWWKIMQPRKLAFVPKELQEQMAGQGMVTIMNNVDYLIKAES